MTFEERPWGNYTILSSDATFQVKKLVVNSGRRLSLESHKFRAEHWFVVQGLGICQLDGAESILNAGDSIDMPIESKHRISCISEINLVFIEVQTGSSFEEDDIVRYREDFGRS